jgi:hypothetical protein
MKNASRTVALALVAVFALTGCLRMNVDMTLNADNTVDTTMVVAIQEGVGESLGMSDDEVLEQLTGELGSDLDGGTQEPYNEDGYIGTKVTMNGQSLDEIAGEVGTEGLSITREGDTFVVDGALEDAGSETTDELPAGAEVTVSITFPGEVTEHNGTLEGTTVTWDLMDAPETIHAVGGATTEQGLPAWLMIALAVLLFLAIVAVVGVIAFRSRAKTLAKAEEAPVIAPVESEPAGFVPDAAAAPVVEEPTAPVIDEPTAEEPEQK